jgi:alkylation response protein AidB-like acyl-CoA dehydrogenase
MDFNYGATAEAFRAEVRAWLGEHLVGAFAELGAGAEFADAADVRREWEREMGRGGWLGLAWPRQYGGRQVSLLEELVFNEEYVRARGPQRVGFFGEQLLGPTLMMFGTEAQRQRFLPRILRAEDTWCQGFSEPGAGSDLANVGTSAELDGDRWVVNGQKVWTSRAQYADWIFVLCRTAPAGRARHEGLSFLLVPMGQPGVEVRPLVDMTGDRHFCEVFFDGAITTADCVVGAPGDGWRVAMGTLGFERGTAFLARQLQYAEEYATLLAEARRRGVTGDPDRRDRLAQSFVGLSLLRFAGYRTLTLLEKGERPGATGSLGKLQWSQWHQRFGELAMDVLGTDALLEPGGHRERELWHNFLFSRAHTIYAGSSQIQRNIIGERILGLPREVGPGAGSRSPRSLDPRSTP